MCFNAFCGYSFGYLSVLDTVTSPITSKFISGLSPRFQKWDAHIRLTFTPSVILPLPIVFRIFCSWGVNLIFSPLWLFNWVVMPFAFVELVAVGFAFLVYARHATDGEEISLQGAQLVVELEKSGRRVRSEFNRDWVRVEPLSGDGSLIELSGQGRKVQVGRYVRPELRAVLAREIRMALRTA